MSIQIHGENGALINGRLHAPVTALARLYKLPPGYLTQLARTQQLEATQIAGVWYISIDSLAQFQAEEAVFSLYRNHSHLRR